MGVDSQIEKIMSRAEFAEQIGVSRSAVTQAAAEGRFRAESMTPQGFLKWPAALLDWHGNRDPRGGHNQKPAPLPISDAEPPTAALDDDDPASVVGPAAAEHMQAREGTLAYERMQTMRLRRQQIEGEIAAKAGRLRPIEEIETAAFDLARELRKSLAQMSTWAAQIAALGGDAEKIRAYLRDRSREIMQNAADGFAALATGKAADHVDSSDDESGD